jgi:hypothetical protein
MWPIVAADSVDPSDVRQGDEPHGSVCRVPRGPARGRRWGTVEAASGSESSGAGEPGTLEVLTPPA